MLRISVVITARNAEKTIGRTIRSLLRAMSSSDEILILLDKCSDNTSDSVSKFKDKRIKVFESQTGMGRSSGRNFLIEKSTAEYIAICDADDIALPWRFKLARKYLRKYDAVFGTAIVFGFQLRPLPLLPQVTRTIRPLEMPLELFARNPLVHSTATFKRSIVVELGGYRESEAEEYDLWLRMVNSGKLLFRTALPVALYRFHSSQASQVPGFVERGLNCRFVIEEQEILSRKLDLEGALSEKKKQALSRLRRKGILSYLEVQGLPPMLRKWKDQKKSS